MRAFILVMDSFGIGASQDAAHYGDQDSNTFYHIAKACADGQADKEGVRQGVLHCPQLASLGLGLAGLASSGFLAPGFSQDQTVTAAYGYAVEKSLGKDTPSGHWEMAGVPVMFEWGYFKPDYPSFPEPLIDALIEKANLPGVLGNKHASGTEIIAELGQAHIDSGKPIVYTSADSVFQIAAHEQHFGLEKLYRLCQIARELVDDYNIGRVIARPFIGEPGEFTRTANRRDYATPPPEPTLLDQLISQKREVIAIGKIADIFAHQGISQTIKADGNMALFDETLKAQHTAPAGSLVFTNFVDFDSHYGHRRDVIGYAHALEQFDARLAEFIQHMQEDDIAIISADHGCDPTQPGSDHTREHIPILYFGPKIKTNFIGRRETFADIGQTVAMHLQISPLDNGVAF